MRSKLQRKISLLVWKSRWLLIPWQRLVQAKMATPVMEVWGVSPLRQDHLLSHRWGISDDTRPLTTCGAVDALRGLCPETLHRSPRPRPTLTSARFSSVQYTRPHIHLNDGGQVELQSSSLRGGAERSRRRRMQSRSWSIPISFKRRPPPTLERAELLTFGHRANSNRPPLGAGRWRPNNGLSW